MKGILLLSIILAAIPVHSVPYFLLTSTKPKCFTVEGPRATTLSISYHAPDMVMLPEDDSQEVQQQKQQESTKQEGLDERFNKRYQDKMIAMQRAGRKMVDFSIVIHQRDTVSSVREWKVAGGGGGNDKSSGRVRRELTERKGTVDYTTSSGRDAPVEVCVQSMAANPRNPSRVALTVSQNVKISKEKRRKREKEAQKHMSKLAEELVQLDRKTEMILTNADYAKDQEADFHELSLQMNRASQYWPMIHLGVLLVTGFTQANHIIRFFKSRHIY